MQYIIRLQMHVYSIFYCINFTIFLHTVPEDELLYSTVQYKRPREGAEKGVVLLSVRYGTIGLCIGSKRGAAFSEAFSHLNLLSTKNETPEKS